jgi:hypothetical protein
MAAVPTDPKEAKQRAFKFSEETQRLLVQHVANILVEHKRSNEMYSKMEEIDRAYARYKLSSAQAKADGIDRKDANTSCGIQDDIVAPIVVSQVDSMVGYLAEVYLSGYPIFPVVSTPANRNWAEMLETLVDDHATLGQYGRQLLLFLRDGVKYNICALEASWDAIEQFSVESDYTNMEAGTKIKRKPKSFTKLKRLDMYNTIWDRTVSPGDVSMEGDYAGYIEVLSRTKLKRLLNKLSQTDEGYNSQKALDCGSNVNAATSEYRVHPKVNNYINPQRPESGVDWFEYITGTKEARAIGKGSYELLTLYVRIQPKEFDMTGVPQQNTPQIWKLRVINGKVIISAKRIISAQDCLPILFGQPVEDGMGYQTKSVAEGAIPFQEGATTLFNIRFAAARRAVSDRALYDPDLISPTDINAPVPAPKIPVRGNALKQQSLDAAYKQIPFDNRGLENVIQDASILVDFSKQLSGQNNARQGQFQKGNKSVQEWNDTMGAADDRSRLLSLTLENQVFIPLKEIIKLNIFQYGEDATVVSQANGKEYEVKMQQLRQQVLSFRISDGETPKSKKASTEMLTTGMQMLGNSPILQQTFQGMLPGMFLHLMQLGGVRGLEEYDPKNAVQQTAPAGLAANNLQGLPAPAATIPPATVPVAPAAVPTASGIAPTN